MKALTVDDMPEMRRIVKVFLEKFYSFEVHEAQNGIQAVGRCMEQDFDLIVADWLMPQMNGLELIGFLRSTPKYEQTPIIMLTTQTEEKDRLKALELGANAYVTKPFDPKTFGETVDALLPQIKSEAPKTKGRIKKEPLRVLIADDDPDFLDFLEEYLGDRFHIETTTDPNKLLKILKKNLFHVLMLDVVFPNDVKGDELAKEIRTLYPNMGIIIVTAYGSEEHVINALRAGADDYLNKPLNPDLLLYVIDEVVQKMRDRQKRIREERLKSIIQASATIDHEIGEPLDIILKNVQTILYSPELELDSNIVRKLKVIEEECKHSRSIIHKLTSLYEPVLSEKEGNGTVIIDVDQSVAATDTKAIVDGKWK